MHFDNIQMIKEAVALGSGVSILPARTMQAEIAQGRLVAVPLHAPDWCGRWASCTAGARSSTPPRKRFWTCCSRPKRSEVWAGWQPVANLRRHYVVWGAHKGMIGLVSGHGFSRAAPLRKGVGLKPLAALGRQKSDTG